MGLPARFGPYVLLEKLGEGAQGDVHVACRANGGSALFVLKRLIPRMSGNDDFVRRFRHEAVIATSVDSPHVVKVYDVGRVGDRLYLVMELVSGWPLSKVLNELRKRRAQAPIEAAVDVVRGALAGLGALHVAVAPDGSNLGIVHRDAAPKNLMLSNDGVVKVIDLGLGRSKRQDWETATGIVMGTPGYLAPEQCTAESIDARADLFTIGLLLFEILTLEPYITARGVLQMLTAALMDQYRPPSSIRSDVPPALDAVVRRAVMIAPELRYSSAAAIIAALDEACPVRKQGARTLSEMLAMGGRLKSQRDFELILAQPIEEEEQPEHYVFAERPFAEIAAQPTLTAVSLKPLAPPRRRRAPVILVAGALAASIAVLVAGSQQAPPPQALQLPPPPEDPVLPSVTARPAAEAHTPIAEPQITPEKKTKRAPVRVERPPVAPPQSPDPPPPPPPLTEKEVRNVLLEKALDAKKIADRTPALRQRALRSAASFNRLAAQASLFGLDAEIRAAEAELARLAAEEKSSP